MRRAGTLGPVVSKILYQPISIGLGIGAGIVARKSFDALWDKLDGEGDGPPKAADQAAPLPKIVAAAAAEVVTGQNRRRPPMVYAAPGT